MYTQDNDDYMPDGLYTGSSTAENSMLIKPSTFEAIYGEGITQSGIQNSPIFCPENVKLPFPSYNGSGIGAYSYQASHLNMNSQFNYNIAMKISDKSEWPVLSDYNMVNSNWSVSNHNKSGIQNKAFNSDFTSEGSLKEFSIGGNSAYIDGAVSWIYSSAMTFYYESTDGSNRGMYKIRGF